MYDSNIKTPKSFFDKNDDFKNNKELNNNFNLTEEKISLEESKVIGVLDNTFIICTHKSGILIIDQHGAHERVLFERALKTLNEESGSSQQLLFPVTMDLMASQFALVQAFLHSPIQKLLLHNL